jgi:DNA/RNA-binding domain of Phe-tRNA-synthetase-like protein
VILDRISREPDMRDLVSLGLVEAWADRPFSAEEELTSEIASHVARLRNDHHGKTAGAIESLQPARALYHALGIDPTRHRPSPEALLRRLLRGEEFPRVHPAVDLANLWAVVSGLPVGLYDVAQLEPGPLLVRRGRAGESYPGIRRPEIQLEGALIIADQRGPFGNPSADSARTAVGPASSHLLFVMFAPSEASIQATDRWVAWLRERVEALLEARALGGVLP